MDPADLHKPISTVFLKKEDCDEYNLEDFGVKEEVESICDDEQGFLLGTSFENEGIKQQPSVFTTYVSKAEENNQFLLGSINDDGKQGESYAVKSDVQIKKKRRKERKLENIEEVKFSQRAKACLNTPDRVSRDAVFQDKEYFCDLCQKLYHGRKSFKTHLNVHFTISQNKYICLVCNSMFGMVGHMNHHFLVKHFLEDKEVENLFVCYHCKKRFFYKRDLQRHMFSHTGEGGWKCNYCYYSCTTKYNLFRHMCTHHSSSKSETVSKFKLHIPEFVCDHCKYITTEKTALRTHIKRHMKNKSFKCQQCNYMCITNGDLKKHSVIHSDERPFGCSRCHKTFKRRSHLLDHFNLKYGCSGRKRGRRKPRV